MKKKAQKKLQLGKIKIASLSRSDQTGLKGGVNASVSKTSCIRPCICPTVCSLNCTDIGC